MLVCEIHASGSRCLLFSVFYRPSNTDEAFLNGLRTFFSFKDIGVQY